MSRTLTIHTTEREAMLIRDAIALALGGTARLTKADRKRLVEIAEHVLLRAVLSPENPAEGYSSVEHRMRALAASWEQEATEPSKREMSNELLLKTVAAEIREQLK